MAKRIDTVFTADPNAGNDPSKTASVAVDFGTSTEEAYSLEQISSVVANRLGISENLPDQATFSARFPDNSLVATVDPIQTAYEYYVINTTGTTPTSGGSTGALAFTAADWDPYTYYLFISNNDSTYTQVEPADSDINNDGLDPLGLTLQAKYLLAPPSITDLVVTVGANGSGEMQLDFTLPTVVDGISTIIAYFNRTDNGSEIARFEGITDGATVSNLPNGVEINITIVITANNNEQSQSNIETKTIPVDTVSTYDGEIYIVPQASGDRYEATEGSNISIEFGLRNRQTTTANKSHVTFEVRTVDDTAKAGTNYTALADPTTVSIPLDGTTNDITGITQAIVTSDEDEGTNLVLQLHIIPESVGQTGPVGGEVATADIVPYTTDILQPNSAVLAYINGTGGASGEAYEISTTLTDGTETNKTGFLLNAIENTSASSGSATGTEDLTVYPKADAVSGATNIATNNNDYYGSATSDFTYNADPNLSYITTAPRKDYLCDFGTGNTGTYYLYARVYADATWKNKAWFGMDGNPNAWSNGESVPCKLGPQVAEDWKWRQVLNSADDVPISITVTTEGEHTLNLWKYLNESYFDRFCWVNSNTFDDLGTLDPAGTSSGTPDSYGVAANSLVAGGDATDDVNNIGGPTRPVPPTDDVNPTASISDNATGIGTTTPITFTWPAGYHSIQALSFAEVDAASNPVNGTLSVVDNVLTWTPNTRFQATVYTIDASGIVVDNDGATKTWEVVDLDFTTVNPAGTGVILTLNPAQWPVDHDMTQAEIITWIGGAGGTNVRDHIDNGGIRNVLDPLGSGERVWKVLFEGGYNGTERCGFRFENNLASEVDEIYWMIEMALCSVATDGVDWLGPMGMHMSSAEPPAHIATTTITDDNWSYSQQYLGNNAYVDSVWGNSPNDDLILEDHGMTAYLYTQTRYQSNWLPNTDFPTSPWTKLRPSQTYWKVGQYVTCESRLKVNDPGVGNGIAQMWIDGQICMDVTNVPFRGAGATDRIAQVPFKFWTGGPIRDPKYLHPQTQWLYIKNFIVSTDPITH